MNGSSVKVYSLRTNGNDKLSKNFRVREFKCKDGSDTIFISDELVEVLQDLRDHFNSPVNINSGYRTDVHNKSCGGSAFSRHKYGQAADIKIKGYHASLVYNYLDNKYPNKYGLGKADTYTHVDVRITKTRWKY